VDRAFLDANVLFSAAYRDGAAVRRLWDLPDIQLITSGYAIEEARRNLETAVQRVRLIEQVAKIEQVETPFGLPEAHAFGLPEKDVPILAAAIAAQATHLLTNDLRHFGNLFGQVIHGVLVMKAADYLRGKLAAGG